MIYVFAAENEENLLQEVDLDINNVEIVEYYNIGKVPILKSKLFYSLSSFFLVFIYLITVMFCSTKHEKKYFPFFILISTIIYSFFNSLFCLILIKTNIGFISHFLLKSFLTHFMLYISILIFSYIFTFPYLLCHKYDGKKTPYIFDKYRILSEKIYKHLENKNINPESTQEVKNELIAKIRTKVSIYMMTFSIIISILLGIFAKYFLNSCKRLIILLVIAIIVYLPILIESFFYSYDNI